MRQVPIAMLTRPATSSFAFQPPGTITFSSVDDLASALNISKLARKNAEKGKASHPCSLMQALTRRVGCRQTTTVPA